MLHFFDWPRRVGWIFSCRPRLPSPAAAEIESFFFILTHRHTDSAQVSLLCSFITQLLERKLHNLHSLNVGNINICLFDINLLTQLQEAC